MVTSQDQLCVDAVEYQCAVVISVSENTLKFRQIL